MYKVSLSTMSCSIVVFFALVVLLFRELLFPNVTGLLLVKIRKDEVEHIRVPFCRTAFDPLLDILSQRQLCSSFLADHISLTSGSSSQSEMLS